MLMHLVGLKGKRGMMSMEQEIYDGAERERGRERQQVSKSTPMLTTCVQASYNEEALAMLLAKSCSCLQQLCTTPLKGSCCCGGCRQLDWGCHIPSSRATSV